MRAWEHVVAALLVASLLAAAVLLILGVGR